MCDFIRKNFTKVDWNSLFFQFFMVVFFNILPTLVIIFWFLLKSGASPPKMELLKEGQFLLYAVSFFSSSYVVMNNREFNDWKDKWKGILFIPTLLTSICYTFVFMMKEEANNEMLILLSYSALFLSIFIFFIAQFWNSRELIDLGKKSKNDQDKIIDKLK